MMKLSLETEKTMQTDDKDDEKTSPVDGTVLSDVTEEDLNGVVNEEVKEENERPETSSSTTKTDEHNPPDGGWGWLVVIFSFFAIGASNGVLQIVGIVYSEWIDARKNGTDQVAFETSWIMAIQLSSFHISGPLAGILIEYMGIPLVALIGAFLPAVGLFSSAYAESIPLLCLLYGFIPGFGCGLLWPVSVIILGHYFKKYLGIVTGIASAGSPAISITLSLTLKNMFKSMGLVKTMQTLGSVFVPLLLCGLIYRPKVFKKKGGEQNKESEAGKKTKSSVHKRKGNSESTHDLKSMDECETDQTGDRNSIQMIEGKREEETNPSKEEQDNKIAGESQEQSVIEDPEIATRGCCYNCTYQARTLWRNKNYRIWFTACCLNFISYYMAFGHLVNHASHEFPDRDADLLITYLTATSGVMRIIVGVISDHPKVIRIRVQQLSYLLFGISLFCVPFAASFEGLIALSVMFGITDAVIAAIFGPIHFDLLGPKLAGQGLGFCVGSGAIPVITGITLSAYIFDSMDSYAIAFYIAGAAPTMSALIMCFIRLDKNTGAVHATETETSNSTEKVTADEPPGEEMNKI